MNTLPHPHNHFGCEVFTFGEDRWCVTLAWETVTADPGAADYREQVDVTAAAGMLHRVVWVDPDHAMTVDLARPLLLARYPVGDARPLLIVDGWHRAYRALVEGRTTLPAHILTEATADAVHLPAPGAAPLPERTAMTSLLCANHNETKVPAIAVLVLHGPPESAGAALCASCASCADTRCGDLGDVLDVEYNEPWCAEHAAGKVYGPEIVALDSDRYRALAAQDRRTR